MRNVKRVRGEVKWVLRGISGGCRSLRYRDLDYNKWGYEYMVLYIFM